MSAENAVSHNSTATDALTASIVAAYVGNNAVPACDLPGLIKSVRGALDQTDQPQADAGPQVEKPSPAQIKKSVTHEAIISFIDGKPYKTLRRHLTTNGLTPESYRIRYGLPVDYPVVSAAYSEQRSELAKTLGLGQIRRKATETMEEPAQPTGSAKKAAPKRRKGPETVSESAAA